MSVIKTDFIMLHQRAMLVLLALILFMKTTSPQSFRNFNEFICPEMDTCSCTLTFNEYEVHCPGIDPQIIVRIEPKKYTIECLKANQEVYALLPVMNIGEIRSVEIRRCPFPLGTSIQKIINHLGSTKLRSLFIRSYGANLGGPLIREHLKGFNDLERLELSDNGLSDLPEDLFADLKNLTWLDLKRNRVHLPHNIFKNLEKLEYLELGYNNLENLEAGIFANQKKLKMLNLWGNKLKNLSKEVFQGISSITQLDLSANSIETLRPDVFDLLTNITNLSLSLNKLRYLPEGLFRENKKLIEIKIVDNHVEMPTFPSGLFADLTQLKVVRIKCALKSVPGDLFKGSINIENITLSGNLLELIPPTILANQSKLLELNLSRNKLMGLPDELFANTPNLRVLKLSHNQLSNISRTVFGNLGNLQEIYLNDNRLYSIHPKAFIGMRSLQMINLQNNEITFKDEETGLVVEPNYDFGSPFQSLTELTSLNLRNNSLTTIYRDWIFNLNNLKDLDLSYNNITMLKYDDLQFISQDIIVNLTHNSIHEIIFRNILFVSYENNPKKVKVLLDSNPLACNCVNLHFVQFLRNEIAKNVKNILQISANNLQCASPPVHKGKIITKIHPRELLCPLDLPSSTIKKCPAMCTCDVRVYDKAIIINCANANLTEIPPLPEASSQYLNFIELHIENNSLTRLPDATTPGFADAKEIYASNNQISTLSPENIPINFTILDIAGNNFETLNFSIAQTLNRTSALEKLYLSGNPWICDCESEIVVFVRNNFRKIPDLDKMVCSSGEKMETILPRDLCAGEERALIAASTVIAILGLCFGVMAVLYYKYQQEIKVWLFAHNMCLWFVTEEELDKDKKYDAFISYSHKDEDFVTEHLVPKLENGPNPFKLCLHIRDWVVGEFIPNQIAKSVEDSKRTIVVLSPNFLESIWGRMEFRAAHTAALSEGRARVIVIIYGDIGETDNLDPELNAYLKMNTYVKWNDPWFWDKLRYALPHPSNIHQNVGLVKTSIKSSLDDKLELIKPSPVTPPLTTPPAEQATKNPLICKLNEGIANNGKLPNGFMGHVNGAFIINTNAKQSDV